MPADTAPPPASHAIRIDALADLRCIVLGLDRMGTIIFMNAFALDFFGYPSSEIIGLPVVGTIISDNERFDPGTPMQTDEPEDCSGNNPHQLCRCRRKSGGRAWIVWSHQPSFDASATACHWLLIGHDVTRHISAESMYANGECSLSDAIRSDQCRLKTVRDQLMEAKRIHAKDRKELMARLDRYRLFCEATSEGIVLHDNGIAIDVNDAFEAMAECPRDQIIGKDIVSLFISQADANRVKNRLASNDLDFYEVSARSATGRTYPAELRSQPASLAGRPCRVVCVRDISQRKKVERRMIQSQKMEAIGTLASGIAHDFNNLLAGIQGNVELIRHQLSPQSPHHKGLDLIRQIVDRGVNLSGQILGYARGGKSELTEIDLNHLVINTLDLFGAANQQVHVETRLHDPMPLVRGDRTQIEQILLNLMINAIQAMPAGGTLTIETKPTELTSDTRRPYEVVSGSYAMLVVHDTGHGMDRKTRERIFEPFFTTKADGQGTGLGLAATYGIVKKHGGYIDVSSETGVGSRFSVLLPAFSGPKDKESKETANSTTAQKETQTILMVDDETDFLLLGRQMLSLLGYQPITAANCSEALTRFKQSATGVGLVIMDMIMPDGAVEKTIQHLRELDPQVRILLSSGHSQNGEIGRRLMQYCDGFIQKPFRLASLSQKIKELLGTAENEDQ